MGRVLSTPPPGLSARGLVVRRGGVRVLSGASLVAAPGRIVAVIGPSGSGKTTLLLTLAGMLLPDAGTIILDDTAVEGLSSSRRAALRRTRVAFLSQELELLGNLSAMANVAVAALLAGWGPARAWRAAAEELDHLGLSGVEVRRRSDRLSRGQRQRVALARALVVPKRVTLLDEPTTALDAPLRRLVIERMAGRARNGGVVVVATHDAEIAEVADSTYRLAEP